MTVALIVAAGSGERLGAPVPKAFVELAGRPLVQWSIDALREVGSIEQIVLALPGDPGQAPAGLLEAPGVLGVPGGAVRSASVRAALAAAQDGDPVLVHDAARPLLAPALAEAVLAALVADERLDGAVAAAPVSDTIKRADESGRVLETLQRSQLWSVQTPQVFRRAALERALAAPAEVLARATDDAWLIEREGGSVAIVPAGAENIKVTTARDLRLAALLLAERPAQARSGSADPA
jgi:2-C-methyl-D-erythritol 4-phosphate cytidylyltransferase